MPAAILFRGHAHRPPGQTRPFGVDWRRCVESHRKYLLGPMRARYGHVGVFLSCYDTPHRAEIERDYEATDGWWERGENTQRGMVLRGLDHVQSLPDRGIDVIAVCRFDIELKGDPLAHPGFDPQKINFLWREWNDKAWEDHRRVPDALFFLPGRFLEGFRRGVANTPSETCLHLVYHPVAREVGVENLNVMDPVGFVDSNTDVMKNVFYEMIRCH